MNLLAATLSEATFQRQVTDLCDLLGLFYFHSGDSRRDSGAGWPDLAVLNLETGAVVYAELKRENGRPTGKQLDVLMALQRGGHEAYLWRPSDMPEVTRVLKRLAGRRG